MHARAIIIALVGSLAGCDRVLGLEERDGRQWLDGQLYRKRISVNLGARTELIDFPVSIALSDPDLAARVGPAGRDLVFTSAANDILAYEVVDYTSDTGTLEAWVRIPRVAAAAVTELWLYYGGAPRLASATTTWSADIEAVWHLSETGLDSDSTIHGHGLRDDVSVVLVPGIVGDARGFAGGSLTSGDPSDGSLDFGVSSFSISTWVRAAASPSGYHEPIYKGGNGSAIAGYCLGLSANWYADFGDGTGDQTVTFGNEVDLLGGWVHLVAVVDRSVPELRSYTNGARVQVMPIMFDSVDNAYELELGGSSLFRFAGSIDETRLYRRVLSEDWIRAEYRNFALRDDSVLVADEEQR